MPSITASEPRNAGDLVTLHKQERPTSVTRGGAVPGGMVALERREHSGSSCRLSLCLLHCLSSVFTPIIDLHSQMLNS